MINNFSSLKIIINHTLYVIITNWSYDKHNLDKS